MGIVASRSSSIRVPPVVSALVALAPTESKADDGFRVYVDPGYQLTTTAKTPRDR